MDIKLNVTNLEELEALLEEQKNLVNKLQLNASKLSSFCSSVEAAINFSNKDDIVKISELSTKELVDELKKREGVESMFIEHHESKDIHVDGFATVLIVID